MSLLKKIATVVPSLGLVLGLTLGAERPAGAAVLTFEGLDGTCNATTVATGVVPPGYGGLNWTANSIAFGSLPVNVECDAHYDSMAGYGNSYGAPSPTYAAFNTFTFGEIDAVRPLGTFQFNGVSFSSFALANTFAAFSAPSLAINGYRPSDPIGSPTFSFQTDLSSTSYGTFLTGGSWTGLNRLAFLAGNLPLSFGPGFPLIFGGDGQAFLIDNVDVSNFSAVPEPTSMFLLGTGLVGMVVRSRKRRQSLVEIA